MPRHLRGNASARIQLLLQLFAQDRGLLPAPVAAALASAASAPAPGGEPEPEAEAEAEPDAAAWSAGLSKVLAEVHPDHTLDGVSWLAGKRCMDAVMQKLLNKIQDADKELGHADVLELVRQVMPGELGTRALSVASMAHSTWVDNGSGDTAAVSLIDVAAVASLAAKLRPSVRLDAGAAVTIAAVLECIMAEVLELSGNRADEGSRVVISPADIEAAVTGDEELSKLMKPAAGVVLGEWSGHYTHTSGWEAGVRIKFDTVPAVGDSIDIHYIHKGAQGNYETAEVKEAGFADGKLRVVLEGVSVTGQGLAVTGGKQTFDVTADSFVFTLEDAAAVLMTKVPAPFIQHNLLVMAGVDTGCSRGGTC